MSEGVRGREGGDVGAGRVVQVVPDVAGLHRRFDYRVPEGLAGSIRVGSRVRLPLAGRRVGGWVVADAVEPPEGVVLRELIGVSGWGPPPALLPVIEWAAWRWCGTAVAFLRAASPDRHVRELPRLSRPPRVERPVDRGEPGGQTAGRLGEAALARASTSGERPVLVRLAPDEDPIGLIEACYRKVTGHGAEGGAGGQVGGQVGGEGGSLVVLVPSVGWAGRLRSRLERRGMAVAPDWAAERAGWPLVVGSRAAAWSPAPRLVGGVVLDCHDEAYRSEAAPTVDAARVLLERCRLAQVPCLWVSPCPTVVHAAEAGEPVTAAPGDERAGWPRVQVVDRRAADPRTGLLSEELAAAARQALAAPGQDDPVVCVLNRTGRARLLSCSACGELGRCERCGRPVQLVGGGGGEGGGGKGGGGKGGGDEGGGGEGGGDGAGRLGCRRCGLERPVVCAGCGSTRMKNLRPGTARIREELEALLGVPVGEVAGPKAPEMPRAPVLVGTEAVLHRARRASLVAFLDFDQHLLAGRFAAAEEALALVARAGRLVGGRQRSRGRVLLQTRMPEHAVVRAVRSGEPALAASAEATLRAELDLPPWSALALVTGEPAAELCRRVQTVAGGLETAEVGENRWIVRAQDHQQLCAALAAVERPKGRLRVAVDPVEF